MSLYLQRLLDRAANLGAADALRPALRSQSPILAFDQRLGDPDLAADFALLGASADEPSTVEEPPVGLDRPAPAPIDTLPAPARQQGRGRRDAVPPIATPGSTNESVETMKPPQPAPAERVARTLARAAPDPEARMMSPAPATAPLPQAKAAPSALPPPQPAPVQRRASPAPVAEQARPEPALSRPSQPTSRDETAARREPVPPAIEAPARPRPDPVARPRPAETIDETAPAPAPAFSRLRDAPASTPAEPILSAPEPVLPPPQQMRRRDIEALVREAVRAETARQPGASTTPQPKPAATSEAKPEAAPTRPATAAEASVIGPLERSGFNLMLFGVRRR